MNKKSRYFYKFFFSIIAILFLTDSQGIFYDERFYDEKFYKKCTIYCPGTPPIYESIVYVKYKNKMIIYTTTDNETKPTDRFCRVISGPTCRIK